MTEARYWLGVASRDHVNMAQDGGFCQFCHSKVSPVRRLAEGDGVVYYSAREAMGSGAAIRSFTAIGRIRPGEIYQATQSACFQAWRRDVDYWPAEDAPIAPLLGALSFSADNANWGWRMRQEFFEISRADVELIAQAMKGEEEKYEHGHPL